MIPLDLHCPPDAIPSDPPVSTRAQILPFNALSWENFERLCFRLTSTDADVDHCVRYGRQGDAQQGIDIFARQSDGHYHCLQAKRHRRFGPAQIRNAVDLFLSGTWAARSSRFTIAVQAPLSSTKVQEEIERQAARLAERKIRFSAHDNEVLTKLLRDHPHLIDDFFGRDWVKALLGPDVAKGLGIRLDGAALASLREQLVRVYEAQFQFADPGGFGSIGDGEDGGALSLLERFLPPDILVREITKNSEHDALVPGSHQDIGASMTPPDPTDALSHGGRVLGANRMRRLPVEQWLVDVDRLVVLGDAGSGKSTLLRVIALDLLRGHTHFSGLAARWGQRTPIYIPFARWSSQIARDGSTVGIKQVLRLSLEPFLTQSMVDLLDRVIEDGRILLLVDGLDEWSSEQVARSTLSTIVTTVEAHRIPVLVSGRPRGLERIGTLPSNWQRGAIAPLSKSQQAAIAGRWFQHYAAVAASGTIPSDGSLRTARFMADLARDASLGALAAVPLLLVGLVALALRGQILPRTRSDIYDQLTKLLLEVHPDNRATASGDIQPRFRHATDPDQRRAAIARLAFAMREDAIGAGTSVVSAREILRSYLASPGGFDLSDSDATAVAAEILAVNAETQGMLIENAPGEVGFAHSTFEEFLAAEHISGWPFARIQSFVRLHSGEGRWRNVIATLLCRMPRRDELEQLIAEVEGPEPDEILRFHKQALLGDIAFGVAGRAPATAKRLALDTMRRVEREDWLPSRREALGSTLKALADPTLGTDVEDRLERWLPSRLIYRSGLISELGRWSPSSSLQDTLLLAMKDEDRGVQRAAASTYAHVFARSPEACQRLVDELGRTRDLSAAAAMLESLAHGWAGTELAAPLFEEAYRSRSRELRLVGILGLAERGVPPEEAPGVVLHAQNLWSDLSHPHRDLAAAMLIKYWPGDDRLVRGALRRASGHGGSIWEHDVAVRYLLASPTDRADVCTWILDALRENFPFNIMDGKHSWAQVGRFARQNAEIRGASNAYWCDEKRHLGDMHKISPYVTYVADMPVAETLISLVSRDRSFTRHWAVSALLAGWGRGHPAVKPAIDALAGAPDEDLVNLAALVPEIIPDKSAARERLIRMSTMEQVRRDLLAIGLESAGCDHTDDAAIAAIMAFPDQLSGAFSPYSALFRSFGRHPKVRALARARLCDVDAPLAEIAAGYADDPEFERPLFSAATPLPLELRSQIVEVAAAGAAGTALDEVLGRCMLETDPDLRVRMVIAHHRALPTHVWEAQRDALLQKALAVGLDYEAVRAAALAGLVTIGTLSTLASLEDRGKPVSLSTRQHLQSIGTLDRLICERFGDFEAAFGSELCDRFDRLGSQDRFADILSSFPGASPEARTAFLTLAERGEIPPTPRALRALASVRPRSDLLLVRCWEALGRAGARNDAAMIDAQIAWILRDQFTDDPTLRQRLIDRFTESPSSLNAVALAIFAPDTDVLPIVTDFDTLGQEFGDWAVAVHVAASRADASTFTRLLEAMLTRRHHSQFDAQSITNLAVDARLQFDSGLAALMAAKITPDVHPSVSGSFARYLGAAAKIDPRTRTNTLDLVQALRRDQRLPTAGYDALADQYRATRATLLDAISAGFEVI